MFGFRKCSHLYYYHKINIRKILRVFSELLNAKPENGINEKKHHKKIKVTAVHLHIGTVRKS